MAAVAVAAPLRSMLAVAREEVAVVATEVVTTARVAAVEGAGAGGAGGLGRVAAEMNPLAVRQAVEAGVKESMGGSSTLAEHLALSAKPSNLPASGGGTVSSLLSSSSSSVASCSTLAETSLLRTTLESSSLTSLGFSSSSSLGARVGASSGSSIRTAISETLEQNLGATLKEVMSNAGQTGVEEQMDKAVDVAKALTGQSSAAGLVGEVAGVVAELRAAGAGVEAAAVAA